MESVSIYRRKSGIFYGVVEAEGRKKYHSLRTKSKEEALKKLPTIVHPPDSPPVSSPTLQDILSKISTICSDIQNTTLTNLYIPSLKNLISLIGNKRLRDVSVSDVETYKNLRARQCSLVTCSISYKTLRALFNRLLRSGYIAVNPFAQVKNFRCPKRHLTCLTAEELRSLIDLAQSEMKGVLLIATCCGMRLNEILSLTWADVDLSRKLLFVLRTKTGVSRSVPLSDTAFNYLKCKRKRSTFVFTNSNGYRIAKSTVQHQFKKLVRQLGLTDSLRFHDIRHSFAHRLLMNDVGLGKVQVLLGHQSISTTVNTYGHIECAGLHAEVNKIQL